MRILIVGDFSSIHIYNFICNVIKCLDCDCEGYHIIPDAIKSEYIHFYNANKIKITQGIDPIVYRQKGAFTFIRQSVNLLTSLGKFDFVHVHAVRSFISLPLYFARKNFKRIILTYWGSDLFRTSTFQLLATAPLLSCANIITVLTHDMLSYFKALPWYISRNRNKIRVFDFGNMFFEKIDYYIPHREKLKEEFNLDSKKLLCTIGYVGRPQMQQVKTVESILSLLIKKKDVIQLAIPAYGISTDDLEKLNSILMNSGIKYGIFTEFMDPEKVSKFRVITDIFIHAQTTDAISSAMVEHLFAGSIVINGEWLKYSILDENKIVYKNFEDFHSLSSVLKDTIDNLESEKCKAISNRSRIERVWSWDYLRQFWIDLFQ